MRSNKKVRLFTKNIFLFLSLFIFLIYLKNKSMVKIFLERTNKRNEVINMTNGFLVNEKTNISGAVHN